MHWYTFPRSLTGSISKEQIKQFHFHFPRKCLVKVMYLSLIHLSPISFRNILVSRLVISLNTEIKVFSGRRRPL